jgi:hypothetical protein
VKRSGKQLKYIVVNASTFQSLLWTGHAAPGLPDARVVATDSVIAEIEDYGPKARCP